MRATITPAVATDSTSPATSSEMPASVLDTTKNDAVPVTAEEASTAAAPNTNSGGILTWAKRPAEEPFARGACGTRARSAGIMSSPAAARAAPPHEHPAPPPRRPVRAGHRPAPPPAPPARPAAAPGECRSCEPRRRSRGVPAGRGRPPAPFAAGPTSVSPAPATTRPTTSIISVWASSATHSKPAAAMTIDATRLRRKPTRRPVLLHGWWPGPESR